MSVQISNAFIKQYEAEVKEAYQRQGSKLRGTIRTVNNVTGADVTFQKVGTGVAGTKDRHGLVPVMNLDHTPVVCTLTDYYAGDWVDKFDLLKTNIDERQVVVNAGAMALGRQTDTLILASLAAASNTTAHGSVGMTRDKFLASIASLAGRDVPVDDGGLTFVCSWTDWTDLSKDATFASADYVEASEMPYKGKGLVAKNWYGVMVMPHSAISGAAGVNSAYIYHRSALGHAIGAEIQTDITWHGDRAAHFVNNMMSQGACLIDTNGVQIVQSSR